MDCHSTSLQTSCKWILTLLLSCYRRLHLLPWIQQRCRTNILYRGSIHQRSIIGSSCSTTSSDYYSYGVSGATFPQYWKSVWLTVFLTTTQKSTLTNPCSTMKKFHGSPGKYKGFLLQCTILSSSSPTHYARCIEKISPVLSAYQKSIRLIGI